MFFGEDIMNNNITSSEIVFKWNVIFLVYIINTCVRAHVSIPDNIN